MVKEDTFACLLCCENESYPDSRCLFVAKTTSNLLAHHRSDEKHRAALEKVIMPLRPAPPPAHKSPTGAPRPPSSARAVAASAPKAQKGLGGGALGPLFLPGGRVKVSSAFTLSECQRQHTRALLVHSRPMNMAQDTEMKILFQMLGSYKPPDRKTMTLHRRSFVADCKERLADLLIGDGVVVREENLLRSPFGIPLLSLSFDTSPTGLPGVKAISITMHWTNAEFVAKSFVLAVESFSGVFNLRKSFDISTHVHAQIQSARSLATWRGRPTTWATSCTGWR